MSQERNEIVLDLETKSAPREWGVRDELKNLGVSVVGVWSLRDNILKTYREEEIGTLAPILQQADRLIGFAIQKFDLPVLQPYLNFDLEELPALDMFEEVSATLGHRISLSSLAKATLGSDKSGHGLDAVAWYREGNWKQLEEYCLQDVRLTGELYRYGTAKGHLLFESLIDRKVVSVPVAWGMQAVADVWDAVHRAEAEQKVLEIDYVSRENAGESFLKTRKIEIKAVRENEIEAYDHLRQDVRNFRVGRIVAARLLNEPIVPRAVPQSLFPA